MKTRIIFLSIVITFISFAAEAQVKVDVKKKVNREANYRANSQTDKVIDKSFDKLEEGVGSLFKKKDKTKEGESEENVQSVQTPTQGHSPATQTDQVQAVQEVPAEQPKPQLIWSRYDFVPGTEIIFEDNQEGEQNGEFPSKWDLKTGTVENAVFDNSNVIFFRETGNFPNGIIPLIENSNNDYLPDEFTVEFDAYFPADKFNTIYKVSFYDTKNQKRNNLDILQLYINNARYGANEKMFPGATRSNIEKIARWRHIAISFNKRALKVYMDDARLLNIPNITDNPTGISIGAYNHTDGEFFIKNIRIAKGAVPLYDKFLTDGKFVTTGIKFDVNKATIKPESMGTINYVVKMMTEHPELKFSVEGHTDSDGDETLNQKLSEARAKAVMDNMIDLGISTDRLTSKGHGESKPMAGNDTPEGKAQNRRVEFVKF